MFWKKIRIGKHFSLQLDVYTDLSKNAQLLPNVRFVDEDIIKENFLFCKALVKITGEKIFCITTEYLENENLQWENRISICTDGAAAMVGRNKGFVSRVKERTQNDISKHYFLHCKALVSKTLRADLVPVLNDVVSMVNFIKMRPAKSCFFALLCERMGAEHATLLFHIEVRWLLWGKVRAPVYELREELKEFSTNERSDYAQLLASDE